MISRAISSASIISAPKDCKKRDNINEKLADEIIASQCSFEYKKKYADIIIDNSGTRANTKKQIRLALAQVKIKNDN